MATVDDSSWIGASHTAIVVTGSRPARCVVAENMAANELSIEEIHKFFIEKGGKVSNRELVKHFKAYLTNVESKGKRNFCIHRQLNEFLNF